MANPRTTRFLRSTALPTLLIAAAAAAASSVITARVTTREAVAPVAAVATPWLSGASGTGAANGSLGSWRGTPLAIGGTWNDSLSAQTEQWTLQPRAEWGAWTGDLDVAVGAIYSQYGETWAAAAAGRYDFRWRIALTKIRTAWDAKPGTLHIRFAHEFNGDWTPWAVRGADAPNFIRAWRRFRAHQKAILPAARLVLCPNDGSSLSLRLDWRRAFPGRAYLDEMSVDSYNQYPFAATEAQFTAKSLRVDAYGAPVGIERHRQYAAQVGLPMAVSEWSSNASMGDSPAFIRAFRGWVAQHAGRNAGQVPYEVLFNVGSYGGGVFQLYPMTRQPLAAAEYRRLF